MRKKKENSIKKIKNKNKEKIKRGKLLVSIFKVNDKFNFKALLKNIVLPIIGALVIGYLTRKGITSYNTLKKPIFTPPNIIFPIVWIILYILMGISSYRIYMKNSMGKNDDGAYFHYLIQLVLNFLWPIVFFNLKLYGMAFILIIILIVLIIITTIKFFKVDKVSSILMVPYIFWVSYASVLNFFIWMLNEM